MATGANTLPIEISDYPLVFIMLTVQGRPVRALIDTGSASPVRLSLRLAQELKLPLEPVPSAMVQGLDGRRLSVRLGSVETLELGGVTVQTVEIEVAGDRVESVAAQVGTPFDVMLGWAFLSRYNFVLDYRKRLRVLSHRAIPAPPGPGAAIPYSIVNRLPVVQAKVAGQDVQLLLDTGAPMCNLDASFAQTSAGQIVSCELLLGGRSLAVDWRVKDLAVTRQALGTVGALGNNLLGLYAVHVDTRSRTVTLNQEDAVQ